MADITYTLTDSSPEDIAGFEQFSAVDKNLIESFKINNLFDSQKHFTELHIYSLADDLLESDSNYSNYSFLANAQSAGRAGASVISIDPIKDSIAYGYPNGGVKLLYHFINDLFTQDKSTAEFFINGISDDRTELRLLASTLSENIVEEIALILGQKLIGQSYFDGFRLNFGDNELFIGVNISTIEYNNQIAVTVKLYEPLPDIYGIGSTLNIVEIISDSVSYEISAQAPAEVFTPPTLKSPNFNIDIQDNSIVPSQYLNYNELFSYPVNNTNSQIYSVFNEKGIEISIDYTDYSDFIHFSSAQERLLNFKYKLDLISSYSGSLSSLSTTSPTLAGTSGSTAYYNGLIQGIVSNFDHYERFLYYESGSSSWPKTNNTKPYINTVSTAPAAITWYTGQINEAVYFDSNNNNLLVNTIPTYLRDDVNNENYLTFIHMIGQHFDNLWLYGKAVTDKYDADNRLDYGISRDLVAEALKNFGVQLYTSNRSIQDLFTTIIGQSYQSGSEQITNYITGSYTGSNASIQPSSYDNYQKEVYKRIYHNLPLLLSSKGTERGVRALINCFGIPSDILQIKLYGGRNRNERPFYGDYKHYTSSLDKIRLDNTGSIITGSTLSQYTSIIKRDDKYTDDLHPIEVGFSPTDNVDNYIISRSLSTASLASFNIDDYLGDPRNLYQDSYYTFSPTGSITGSLSLLTNQIMSGSTAYNVQDFVRLIKFYDNTIFKMIKDFIPARAIADTGIIIKPHVLSRSKAKSVILSGSRPFYTGSIDTAFISAGDTNKFKDSYSVSNGAPGTADTRYYDNVQTPTGIEVRDSHYHYEVNYNGEVSASNITVSTGELNKANPYKVPTYSAHPYPVSFISESNEICLLNTNLYTPSLITNPNQSYSADAFFTFINPNCVYSGSINGGSTWVHPITFPTTFPIPGLTFTPGAIQPITLRAFNKNVIAGTCVKDNTTSYAPCTLMQSTTGLAISTITRNTLQPGTDITAWFTAHPTQILHYTASWNDPSLGGLQVVPLPPGINDTYLTAGNFRFNQPVGTVVTIKVTDQALGSACQIEKPVTVAECNLKRRNYQTGNASTNDQLPETGRGFIFRYTSTRYIANPLAAQATILPNIYFMTVVYGAVDSAGIRISQSHLGGGYTYEYPANSTNFLPRFYGIQSYFRNVINDTGFSGAGIDTNPALRYNIYVMTNPDGQGNVITGSVQNTEGYELHPIALAIDPREPVTNWPYPNSNFTTEFLGIGYTNIASKDSLNSPNLYNMPEDPLSATETPSLLPITFKPIVLPTQTRNTIQGTNYTPTPIAQNSLIRAYVIECYNESNPACMAQVVVYGEHSNSNNDGLYTAEGIGTYPQFRFKNILVGWNYHALGVGGPVTPPSTPYPQPTPGFGPWITVKVRTYSPTPTPAYASVASGISPNTPPD